MKNTSLARQNDFYFYKCILYKQMLHIKSFRHYWFEI